MAEELEQPERISDADLRLHEKLRQRERRHARFMEQLTQRLDMIGKWQQQAQALRTELAANDGGLVVIREQLAETYALDWDAGDRIEDDGTITRAGSL